MKYPRNSYDDISPVKLLSFFFKRLKTIREIDTSWHQFLTISVDIRLPRSYLASDFHGPLLLGRMSFTSKCVQKKVSGYGRKNASEQRGDVYFSLYSANKILRKMFGTKLPIFGYFGSLSSRHAWNPLK